MSHSKSSSLSKAAIEVDVDMFADLPPLDPFEVKKDQIAAQLAALLSHSGKTRTEIAEALGWKKSRVTNILSGRSNLTTRTIWDFCSSLSFDFDVIFRHASQPIPPQPWQQGSIEALTLPVIASENLVIWFEEHTPEKIAADVKNGTNWSSYITISGVVSAESRCVEKNIVPPPFLDLASPNISATEYSFAGKIKPEIDSVPLSSSTSK